MNYRHAYHAGNFADVVKHTLLLQVLDHLRAKPAPFAALDTHAGAGLYDLEAAQPQRTGEFRTGIGQLLHDAATAPPPHPALTMYCTAVQACNAPEAPLRFYPGSPCLIQARLRPDDRLTLVEKHPEAAQALRQRFREDRRIAVHADDGYLALKRLLPPRERRGLVLIDPPFEDPMEWTRLVEGLVQAYRRWSTGHYLLWYPIKERAAVWRFHAALEQTGIPRMLAAEVLVHPEDDPFRLNGCGLLLVNPPWPLTQALPALLTDMAQRLSPCGHGRLDWIRDETGATGS